MHYYEVWVRSHRYRKTAALTYSADRRLQPGQLVIVPLQRDQVPAIVYQEVTKPSFPVKPVADISNLPPLPPQSLRLYRWLQQYYPAPVGPLTQLFVPAKLPTEPATSPARPRSSITTPPLTNEQSAAVTALAKPGGYLLHGRTGSGKTHVYAARAQQTLQAGRSVLLLSPEISLSPQLAANFQRLLSTTVVIFHSKMTVKERRTAWVQMLTSQQPLVVVGTRSALFAPIANLGLLILDEFHEPAYKQEQQPYYYAPRVAAQLANLHQATLIFGSATPTVSDYFLAQQKQRPIVALRSLATSQSANVQQVVVDLRDRQQFTASPYLSNNLIEAVRASLANGEQALLYLNRRGTARLVLCQHCGWQAACPHCDLPLTYHGDRHQLLCHTCGYHASPPATCPSCDQPDVIFRSAGTKTIVQEAARLFPEARLMRFDTDNTKAERFEQHYQAVRAGNIDILVGTQLLAKGLDLPRLSTLGIILADSSLAIPDFTAQERTYQLIQQVLGRVGRGHTQQATAVIQTYDPANSTIRYALDNDWPAFYEAELAERRQFAFPPYRHLLKLSCQRASANRAEQTCRALKQELLARYPVEVDGPAPAFHEKQQGKYSWQLVVKAKQRSVLTDIIPTLPASWSYDIDPINLL